MNIFPRSLLLLLLLVSAWSSGGPPAVAQPVDQPGAAREQRQPRRAFRAWWADQRWRYRDDAEAHAAFERLVDSASPWPEWHQVNVVTLPVGLRFQMAISPGQGTDRPGAFGTFDHIPDVAYVRRRLAVKSEWKPEIDLVVTYEILSPLTADVGVVGPQIDVPRDRYLPGGGSQLQMTVPAAERMRHLRVIEVRRVR